MKRISLAALQASALLSLLLGASAARADQFVDVKDIPSPGNATELAYSPGYGRLVLKNGASAAFVVDTSNGSSATHLATYQFTDMSLSPGGRYAFVADYGGENIGYGTPYNPSSVHRVDLMDGSWAIKGAYIAGNIQAVSDDTFVLMSLDQWVSFTYDSWPANGPSVLQLNAGYYSAVYSGDFRYDTKSARLLHGNSGLSSQEIRAFKIKNNDFASQETTGTYGSAQGYGSNVALATDSSAFYYGTLSVDALDVTHTLHVFPETIYAATGSVAFGKSAYYDAHTGALLGTLGFDATAYALNANGSDFWVYDGGANLLRHFTGAGVCEVPGAEGAPCDDANACTQTDTCQSGVCVGSNPVVCAASDACHDVGTCNTGAGSCSNPSKADGTACSTGICTAGVCTPPDTTSSGTMSSSTASGAGGGEGAGGAGGSTTTSVASTGSEGDSTTSGPVVGCGCVVAGSDGGSRGTLAGLALSALAVTLRRRRRTA